MTTAGDFDGASERFRNEPMTVLAELRERCPVAHSTGGYRGGPFWALTRHADIVAATLDVERFRNSGPSRFGSARPPLEVDPPTHTRFRRLMQPYFSPARMRGLEPRVRAICAELVRPYVESGTGDAAHGFARPLPARVLLAFMNLPEDRWEDLKAWSEAAFLQYSADPADLAEFQRANDALYAFATRALDDRRANREDPADDMVSGLLAAQAADSAITDDDLVGVIRLMVAAGHDSTTTAVGLCLHRLATDPELQERLRRRPDLIPDAVEELIRHETPVLAMPRTAACDFEFGGRRLHAGDRVLLYFASGNRDAEAFTDPENIDPERRPNRQLSFGHGIHKCIGAPTARLELRVALETWLASTTRFELGGPIEREPWHHFGFRRLPLRVTA